MNWEVLVSQVLINGLSIGAVYVLMALGFTVVFGIMKVVNFAHGAMYMLGAYLLYAFHVEAGIPYLAAVPLSVAGVVVFAVLTERLLVRRVADDGLATLILTLGVGLIVTSLLEMRFGVNPLPVPSVVPGAFQLGGIFIPKARLIVMGLAALALAALYFFVTRARWGRAMRAVSQDPEIATAHGIPSNRVFPLAFGMAGLLVALAGALLAPVFFVSPTIGESALIKSFVVVIIGGMGSVPGAVLAGFLVGLAESASTTFIGADLTSLMIYALVIVVLLVRPNGLFGRVAARA